MRQIAEAMKRQGIRTSVKVLKVDAEVVAEELIAEAGMRFDEQKVQRAIDLARINEALTSIQPKVAQGDIEAVNALEKLLARRERLLAHYKRTY